MADRRVPRGRRFRPRRPEGELAADLASAFKAAGVENHVQATIARSVCAYLAANPEHPLTVLRGSPELGASPAWVHASTVVLAYLAHYEMTATLSSVQEENAGAAIRTDESLLARTTFARYLSDLLRRRKRPPRFSARVAAYAPRVGTL
jgi:hypothetical protein